MLMDDPTGELNDPINRRLANLLIVMAALFMILCEAQAVRGLWFKEVGNDYGLQRYSLPLFIACPAFFLFVFRSGAKRLTTQRQISSNLASRLSLVFGVATIVSYICILELAELAFRAR